MIAETHILFYRVSRLLQGVLFSIGSAFLYYVNHFKLYSSFCASHSKAQKVLHPSKFSLEIPSSLFRKCRPSLPPPDLLRSIIHSPEITVQPQSLLSINILFPESFPIYYSCPSVGGWHIYDAPLSIQRARLLCYFPRIYYSIRNIISQFLKI